MKPKKTTAEEISEAFYFFDFNQFKSMIYDFSSIYELYNMDDEDNWLKEECDQEHEINVRIIRTVYILSKISENYTGMLLGFKLKFPKLWEKLEKYKSE